MKIKVIRQDKNSERAIGSLYVDGELFCFTLEDAVREIKVPGKTAIPAGTYKIIVTYSNRFKKLLPLLLEVPNFEGVRIHSGNTAEHTEGCILVGYVKHKDSISRSREAFRDLFEKINATEDVTLEVSND